MPEATTRTVTHEQASQLLHNKFVVVIGDSIQRSVYKDLVLLLQRDSYLTLSQLKSKGELSFEQDCLVEGGRLGYMTNGTEYREVRQYRTDHHLVRFYFITRIFSRYMESILADFKRDMKPDVVIVNSCVWDVSRYSRRWVSEYKENLNRFFAQLKAILPEESLVVWNMTMPLGKKIIGGFLVPEVESIGPSLRFDVIEANFYGAMLAKAYQLDVLDLHFLFRFSLQHRMRDGVHWNAVAHRQITCFLLAHAAQAWGVELRSHTATGPNDGKGYGALSYTGPAWQQGQRYDGYRTDFCENKVSTLSQFGTNFVSFEEGRNTLPQVVPAVRPVPATPSGSDANLVMKQKQKRKYNPYTRQKPTRPYRY